MTDLKFTPRMPFRDYLAYPAMNASGLRKLIKSPLHYQHEQRFPSESTASMNLGTCVHGLVLEGEEVYHVMPPEFKRRAGKAYHEWANSLPEGSIILNKKEEAQVLGMHDSIMQNHRSRYFMCRLRYDPYQDRYVEYNVLWDHPKHGIPCKARLDLMYRDQNEGEWLTVIDIKTTSGGADASNFGNAIARYDYHMQAAWYFMAAAQEFGIDEEELFDPQLLDEEWYDLPRHRFYYIVVESSAPYAVAVYELDPQSLASGRADCNEMLDLYMDCKKKDHWPSYGHEEDGIPMIGLPRWKRR